MIGIRYAHILGLTAVNAAAERPTAVLIGAVVDKALLAEEALAAVCFYIDRNSVTGFDRLDICTNALDNADCYVTIDVRLKPRNK